LKLEKEKRKNMKKISMHLLTLLLAAVMLSACTADKPDAAKEADRKTEQPAVKQESEKQGKVDIRITKANGETLADKQIEIKKDAILMDVLKAHFKIKENKGFILGIDGTEAKKGEENKYGWLYTVNGKMAEVGAADYKLQSGDTVEFEFQKFD